MITVGAYLRISDDQEGEGLGIERQRQDCIRLAELRGWQVSIFYEDNDKSAFDPTVYRDDFECMLEDLSSGRIQGIITYNLDRFARQPKDLERAIDIYDAHPDYAFATIQGDINLSTPDGRTMARVMVAFANRWSMAIAMLVKRKHEENAQNGKPSGGRAPFGWSQDKITLNLDEAKVLRNAKDDLLAGISLYTIAPKVGMDPRTLRNRLLNPRNCGYRPYQKRGKKYEDSYAIDSVTGLPVKGIHEPLWSIGDQEKIVAILTAPRDWDFYTGGIKNLLTNILRCSSCGGGITGGKNNRLKSSSVYQCKNRGCKNKLGIIAKPVDEYIESLVLDYLGGIEVTAQAEPWPREAELAAAEAKYAELMAAYDNDELPAELVFPRVREKRVEVSALKRERTAYLRKQPKVDTSTIRDRWAGMELEQKREVIMSVIQCIVLRRAKNSAPKLDLSRLEVIFQTTIVLLFLRTLKSMT